MITIKTCLVPKDNFGDSALNSYIVEKTTGEKPRLVSISKRISKQNYLFSGSILGSADANSIIWGSGFLRRNDRVKENPLRVCAVRGRLTRAMLLQRGIHCPEIYGDPTFMLPEFFRPKIKKRSGVGIVPHYKDKEMKSVYLESHVIDICSGIENVITQICECETIISSSLHGLMIADAYGIPSFWRKSSNVIGDGFKFYDYLTIRYQIDFKKFVDACPIK